MATTSIWHVKSNLYYVLYYIKNPEKTMVDPKASALQKTLHYATDEYKAERLYYVSALNCTVQNDYEEMQAVKTMFHQTGGRLAYHGYQSFLPGEVTPDEAHTIGVELARRLWGERYQVVIATHVDMENIHNHFCLNNVSFIDGKKYTRQDKDYEAMREASDQLCREYGKSVLEHTQGRGKHYAEYQAEKEGRPTYKSQIKADIDEFIAKSYNINNFFDNLRKAGYTVRRGPNIKYTSVKPPFFDGKIRLTVKSMGESYTEEAIAERIRQHRQGEAPAQPPPAPDTLCLPTIEPGEILQGKRALYYQYLIILRSAGRRELPYKIRQPLREELLRFERYKAQFDFLHQHKIDNTAQLDQYTANLDSLIDTMTDHRCELYKQRRQGVNTGGEIEAITAKLRGLRKEKRTIANICATEPDIYEQFKLAQVAERQQRQQTQQRGREDNQAKILRERRKST